VKRFKKIATDVLYVSKITKTKNKKILILVSVILSQLTAFTDIALISIFAAIVVDQFSGLYLVDIFLEFIVQNRITLLLLVILRFIFLYNQQMILKKIELSVGKNLRVYILSEIFDKRNYSVADSYFYINILSGHISFFYSNFANFLNSLLQIIAYSIYLILTDVQTVTLFGIGTLVVIYPINLMVKRAREFMHLSYEKGQDSNKEVQRVVENLFLIKILNKDKDELNKFSNTLDKYNFNLLENIKYGLFNSFLPSFLALAILSLVLAFSSYADTISLVFIGVTLRLFQSFSTLTTSINQVVNSHVHIEKFYEMERNKLVQNKENYLISEDKEIQIENISFKYFNSNSYIFKNIKFSIPKNTHTIIIGPNGSGKSTLLGLIAGVLYSETGTVKTFSDKYGYIGATPLIFDDTLYENINYGNNSQLDEAKVIEFLKILETFKESENYNLNRKINNKSLSSGQMQKIAFVRALLSDAKILLLDEATANLDEKSKNTIFSLLKENKFTIINSTHDPDSFHDVDNIFEIEVVDEIRTINNLDNYK
tara:strand:+ start:1253 stop:2875 length:1623 start_codon:yes stop_codon:yes gene_type:complete